jgi:hypothetical protein
MKTRKIEHGKYASCLLSMELCEKQFTVREENTIFPTENLLPTIFFLKLCGISKRKIVPKMRKIPREKFPKEFSRAQDIKFERRKKREMKM